MTAEPQLKVHDIQGHIFPGFGTHHIAIILVKFGNDVSETSIALLELARGVTTLATAIQSREARRKAYCSGDSRPKDHSVYSSIALSGEGLLRVGKDPRVLHDPMIAHGMQRDANALGDLCDDAGKPIGWKYGDSSQTTPDLLIILGSDDCTRLKARIDEISNCLTKCGAEVIVESGSALRSSRKLTDVEHFGFRDNISKPAVRGILPSGDPVSFRAIEPKNQLAARFARPGQPLIWPGEFIFGYQSQTLNPLKAGLVRNSGAGWLKNGSLLVLRRLTQNVDLFDKELDRLAKETGLNPDLLASKIVGRWKHGTALMHSADGLDTLTANDKNRNNHFAYVANTTDVNVIDCGEQLQLKAGCEADVSGVRCPVASHIRKVNPRDSATDLGGEFSTLTRQILRRGIPFGPTSQKERGLLFMCYQTSITNQFRFLTRNWMNSTLAPQAGGVDVLVGRSGKPGNERSADIVVDHTRHRILAKADWVTATGGGYFVTPGISGLQKLLGGDN